MNYRNGYLTIRIPIRGPLRGLLGVLLFLYLAVTVIHLSNGIGFGRALQGVFLEARVAVSCPEKPRLLWDIVNRNNLQDFAIHLGAQLGGSYGELCEWDSLDDLKF
jgi:hypothetical protein